MTTNKEDHQQLHDPLAELERHLISAYLAGAGHTREELLARTDEEARRLLAEASRYASVKLSEVEARAHYLHKLHGGEPWGDLRMSWHLRERRVRDDAPGVLVGLRERLEQPIVDGRWGGGAAAASW
jgi:hypothetical protein